MKTTPDNLETRFDSGEDVLDYFETENLLTIERLAQMATLLNLSALAREAEINLNTLQTKLRRRTPLSGEETRKLTSVLRRYMLVQQV